jgi:hypothetical protein
MPGRFFYFLEPLPVLDLNAAQIKSSAAAIQDRPRINKYFNAASAVLSGVFIFYINIL